MDIKDIEMPGVFAFEFDSAVGRRVVFDILKSIPGVKITKRAPVRSWLFLAFFWLANDELICEFELEGDPFIALEPFGDSAYFWIRQLDENARSPRLDRIRERFAAV